MGKNKVLEGQVVKWTVLFLCAMILTIETDFVSVSVLTNLHPG